MTTPATMGRQGERCVNSNPIKRTAIAPEALADQNRDRSQAGSLDEVSVTEAAKPHEVDEDLATEDTAKQRTDKISGQEALDQAPSKSRLEKKSGGRVAEMVRKIEANRAQRPDQSTLGYRRGSIGLLSIDKCR